MKVNNNTVYKAVETKGREDLDDSFKNRAIRRRMQTEDRKRHYKMLWA